MALLSLVKRRLLDFLGCPGCRSALTLEGAREHEGEIEEGMLACPQCRRQFPIIGAIPRFVEAQNYADSFGLQWNKYAQLQLDSRNGTRFSRERFYSITEWPPESLRDALVLDAGCGAGRFAEIALEDGAEVVALDLSSAIDACRANLREHPSLHCVQGSLFELPFRDGAFDTVYSIGVIQHTPDPRHAVEALGKKVAPGGRIGLWIYERDWKSFVGTVGFKYAVRPLTTRWRTATLEKFIRNLEAACWPIVRWARPRGTLGKTIMRMLPLSCAHLQNIPLSEEDFREWIRLDTFDMLSPAYDSPQRYRVVKSWLESAGFRPDRRHPHGAISITATRPETSQR